MVHLMSCVCLLKDGPPLLLLVAVEGYFSHLSALHNVLTMSQQLNTDILSSPSHKYVAHQMALLYVSQLHLLTYFVVCTTF